ncbi:hypothetical protein PGQ11_002989 [Apiospora arundinis]|uniref:Uncharacterized protein n=1 Tax=Apiospora arundinis TaxID=335852 RepID=A0ABR2J4B8_9PEZI
MNRQGPPDGDDIVPDDSGTCPDHAGIARILFCGFKHAMHQVLAQSDLNWEHVIPLKGLMSMWALNDDFKLRESDQN